MSVIAIQLLMNFMYLEYSFKILVFLRSKVSNIKSRNKRATINRVRGRFVICFSYIRPFYQSCKPTTFWYNITQALSGMDAISESSSFFQFLKAIDIVEAWIYLNLQNIIDKIDGILINWNRTNLCTIFFLLWWWSRVKDLKKKNKKI